MGGGPLSLVQHSPYGVRARRSPQQVLVPGVACSRSQHTRDAGEIAQRKLRGWEGSNPGPRLWYQVRAPHLANPTIKPRCYSGRGGGFYPQSNTQYQHIYGFLQVVELFPSARGLEVTWSS